jgi:acyl-coenzyme A synthetase/AMP-(fatty) acid ligase/thioesterase domain-containing protein/acyl carrier protein
MTRSLFEEIDDRWVAAGPDAIAVIEPGRQVGYGALLAEARRIEEALMDLVPPGAGPCIIDCDRSAEAVAALYACLRYRRPFVLLDEDTPVRRLSWLCEDCGASVVIGRSDGAERVTDPRVGLPTLNVEIDPESDGSLDAGTFWGSADVGWWDLGERELYRVYTSGSTGRPKGASVPARSIAGLIPALIARVPELLEAKGLGLTASLEFDAALQQIFIALATATPLAIADAETRRAVDALMRFWACSSVDIADGTPTLLRMLAAAPRSCGSLSVRTLLIGGDVLRPGDLTNFWARFQRDISVINLYGVAECGIDAAIHRATSNDASASCVPVGGALDHCGILLADPQGQPVTPGVAGEIYIHGDAIGAGYPSDPDSTAARFREYADIGVAYRTGDVGRELTNGEIVVEGRIDRQVKVGGRRVDPAELEGLIVEWLTTRPGRKATVSSAIERCTRCVLSSRHPDAEIDRSGLCRLCRDETADGPSTWGYFGTPRDLGQLLQEARTQRTGDYDAVLLFSGGKDSTYTLYRLLDLGTEFLAFTFDNGFISPAAFQNMERIVRSAGIEHRVLRARDSAALLAESIRTDATVCTGCFKGITTLAAKISVDVGAPVMISGLSRGQIVETKLRQFLRRGQTDLSGIDEELQSHLALYLARRDAQARAIGQSLDAGAVSRVRAVDYFRYDDATAPDVRRFLQQRDPAWLAPKDTGVCSSNCRANDVGIAEHLSRLGFHNYESPLSWDVRLGTLTREEALEQLAIPGAESSAAQVRRELALRSDAAVVQGKDGQLVAFLQAGGLAHVAGLRRWLSEHVPEYMLPRRIEILPDLPRLHNGKIDYPTLQQAADVADSERAGPVVGDAFARQVETAWRTVLGHGPRSEEADFFAEGGDSLGAAEFATELERTLGLEVAVTLVFQAPTFRRIVDLMRSLLDRGSPAQAAEAASEGTVGLQPILAAPDRAGITGAPTVVLMPGIVGRAGPLLGLFAALGEELELDVHAAEFDVAAWGSPPSIRSLARAVASAIGSAELRWPVVVVGWSFGAVLADHVATMISRPDPLPAGRSLHLWLLDPPESAAGEAREIKQELIQTLASEMPQFSQRLTSDASWDTVEAALVRTLAYRDGDRRLLRVLPQSVKALLRGIGPPSDIEAILRRLIRALAALTDETGKSLVSPLDGIETVLVRPSNGAYTERFQGSASSVRIDRALEMIEADHESMTDVANLPFYIELMRETASSSSEDEVSLI